MDRILLNRKGCKRTIMGLVTSPTFPNFTQDVFSCAIANSEGWLIFSTWHPYSWLWTAEDAPLFSLDLHSTHQTQHFPSETCGYSIRDLWKLNIEMCLDDSCQLSFLPSYSHQSDVRTYVHNFLTDYNSTHHAQCFSIGSPMSASKFTKPAAKGDPKAILSHHKIYRTEMCFRWFAITLALGAICHMYR